MAACELNELEDEIKELLENYKYKKTTVFEPCTPNNIKECLIGISEELNFHNIHYLFNPYIDIKNDTLTQNGLVNLINSFWILIYKHKETAEKMNRLQEDNHVLEHCNRGLNNSVKTLKDKINIEKNEARACVASAQRAVDRSDEILKSIHETKAKLLQMTKQKESMEKCLRHEIARLKNENENLLDKLRIKPGGGHVSCSDVCDITLMQLKERERKQRTLIKQLQNTNHDLLREVLALKEEIILGGISNITVDAKKK